MQGLLAELFKKRQKSKFLRETDYFISVAWLPRSQLLQCLEWTGEKGEGKQAFLLKPQPKCMYITSPHIPLAKIKSRDQNWATKKKVRKHDFFLTSQKRLLQLRRKKMNVGIYYVLTSQKELKNFPFINSNHWATWRTETHGKFLVIWNSPSHSFRFSSWILTPRNNSTDEQCTPQNSIRAISEAAFQTRTRSCYGGTCSYWRRGSRGITSSRPAWAIHFRS